MGRRRITIAGTPVGDIEVTVASPTHTRRTDPLPLLVANDGPAYSRRARLVRTVHEAATAGRIPPTRVALFEPGPRDERYAANPQYAEAIAAHVLPGLKAAYATVGQPTMKGASLGALAALQTEWLHPGTFGALFLQSGSFFRKRLDGEEAFEHWDRITAFVTSVGRARRRRTAARIVMTCGHAEGNLANNRLMAERLERLGHDVTFVETRGGHDWPQWQSAFDPFLLDLLAVPAPRHGDR